MRRIEFEKLTQVTVEKVKLLIVETIKEFGNGYDPSDEEDMKDLMDFYDGNKAIMFIGREAERIVGTGALVKVDEEVAMMCRISVPALYEPEVRREKGQEIIRYLESQASEQEFKRVYLEIPTDWYEAIQFFIDNGYLEMNRHDGEVYLEKNCVTTHGQ